MFAKWGLRLRVFLFFALIAVGGAAAIAGGLWLGHSRIDETSASSALVIAGLVAGFALLGLVLWVWLLFDENVAKPILKLAGEMRARVHAGVDDGIRHDEARYLGDIGPAAAAVTENLVVSRNALAEAVARETQRISHQKALLEQVLRDVPAGVVICSADHRVALYNERAIELFPDGPALGLDRPMFDILVGGPIRQAFDRLSARSDDRARADLLCPTRDGDTYLTGQMRLMPNLHGDTGAPGYMLTLHDVTRELRSNFALNLALRESIEKIRRPTANLATVIAALEHVGELAEDQLSALRSAIATETDRLSGAVSEVATAHDALLPEWWPMSEMAVGDLSDALRAHFPEEWFSVGSTEPGLLLRCDSFGLALLLTGAVQRLRDGGAERVEIEVCAEPPGAQVQLVADGIELGVPDLEAWLGAPLDADIPDLTGNEVLLRHGTEIWPGRAAPGQTRLHLPIREARRRGERPAARRPAEFYDFALLNVDEPGEFDDRPLDGLQYVVFDTETTGLLPDEGDEIVQIAAVRIVNGRMLTGETFDTLVNPGRPIPARSTQVHGITEDMVADAPPVLETLERFHAYCGDAVLVAHNAPFDMEFLRRAEPKLGLRFKNRVLDTVLLSAMLYGRTEEHSLDALAERLCVGIPEERRHTALGDSIATAEVFLKMLPMLAGQGFVTLGDTIREFAKYRSLLESVD